MAQMKAMHVCPLSFGGMVTGFVPWGYREADQNFKGYRLKRAHRLPI